MRPYEPEAEPQPETEPKPEMLSPRDRALAAMAKLNDSADSPEPPQEPEPEPLRGAWQ